MLPGIDPLCHLLAGECPGTTLAPGRQRVVGEARTVEEVGPQPSRAAVVWRVNPVSTTVGVPTGRRLDDSPLRRLVYAGYVVSVGALHGQHTYVTQRRRHRREDVCSVPLMARHP